MEKSYLIIYKGDIASDLKKAGIEKYMILNNNLTVIYVPQNFREETLNRIPSITWWQVSVPMSS
ncbi:peptidase S8, partial [Casaltella massiliensis]|nr:peptidase S8 [Casaltella massiliensis]